MDAELTYQAWVNVYSADDQLCHMASTDGSHFSGYCTSGSFPQATWTERTFDLTNVYDLGDLTGESQVWVALIFRTDGLGTKSQGAYVDDLLLRKLVGTTTAARELRTAPGEVPAAMTLEH